MTLIAGNAGKTVEAATGPAAPRPGAVERFDEQTRLILGLRFRGMSVTEIAGLAGCSSTDVSRLISHGVAALLEDAATEMRKGGDEP